MKLPASVAPLDPLEAAWEASQESTATAVQDPPAQPPQDPLEAAWRRAQTTAPVSSADPLERAFLDHQARAPGDPVPPIATPQLRPGVVEFPQVDPAVAQHQERYGSAPTTVVRDQESGATVTVGQPVGIGIPKEEVDRLVTDPSLATRINARLQLLSKPEGYVRKAEPPTFAELLADVFMSQAGGAIVGGLGDVTTDERIKQYVEGGGQFEAWKADVLGAIAATGAVAGTAASGRGMGAGRSAVGEAGSVAARLGAPEATRAMRAGAVKALEDAARANKVHPSLVARLKDQAKRAIMARRPVLDELAVGAASDAAVGAGQGAAGAIAEGADATEVAKRAATSGLTMGAMGAAFHGLTIEQQFRRGYDAARRRLQHAEHLREGVAGEELRRTPAAEASTTSVATRPGPRVEMVDREQTIDDMARESVEMTLPPKVPPKGGISEVTDDMRANAHAAGVAAARAGSINNPYLHESPLRQEFDAGVQSVPKDDVGAFNVLKKPPTEQGLADLREQETMAARAREQETVASVAPAAQTSPPEATREQTPAATATGEPGALGRPAGSGVGSDAVAAAGGSRAAGAEPGAGETPSAASAGTEGQAAATVRDDQGRLRRNLRTVSSEAIADEIVAIGDAIGDAIGEDPSFPTTVGTEGSGPGFVSVWSGMKPGAMKAAGRTRARMQAMQRLTAELERRGENADDALAAALERQAERQGKAEDERRRPNQTGAEDDVAPGVRFSPAEEGEDLFGATRRSASDQGSMFGGDEGSAKSRSLRSTEAAARSELERQKVIASKSTDAAVKQRAQRRVAELERLVNRGEKIQPEELQTRAAAGRDELGAGDEGDGPAQGALFSPAAEETPAGSTLRAILGIRGPAARRAQREVKSLREISLSLGDMAGVPVREGRFGAKRHRALGAFFPDKEVARVIRMDKLDTAAHEVGHYVSKKYLRNPTMRGAAGRQAPVLTMAMKRELVKMGRDLYGNRKPTGGYGEEGIAQWARFYVIDPAKLKADAPAFSAWMETSVLAKEPGLRDAMEQARRDFDDYRKAPATARIDAMIHTKPGFRFPDPARLATLFLDDLAEIRAAVDELLALGSQVAPNKQAYILARLTRGAAGVAEEMIERGIVDPLAGHRKTRGIQQILASLKKEDLQPLRRYLVAERALEFWERGVNSGISKADAEAVVKLYRDKYRKVAEELWAVSNALIDYRVTKKNLTLEEGRQIKAKNKRRVGFYRVFEDDEVATPRAGIGRGFGRNSSGLQKATGSSRDIIDPLESILTDVYKTVKQAHATEVLAALVEHTEHTEGGGRVVEVLHETPQELVKIPIWKVRSQLEALGFLQEGQEPGETPSSEIQGMLFALQDKVTAGARETKDLVRPIVVDGERKWIQIKDAQLYDALSGLGTPEMPMWLRYVSIPTRTLRAGATLTAEFITRNPVRDAVTAAIYSRAGAKVPGYDFVIGLFHVLMQDKAYQRWRLAGGDNAAMLGLDRTTVRKHVKEVLRSKNSRRIGWVLHPIDTLRMLSSLFENATRIGEFTAVEGNAIRRGASPQAAQAEGAIAARDVTIDFAQAGTQTRIVNQLVAFLNANVRGWAKLVRELRDRPKEVLPRIAAWITIPSLLLWWLQKDDEAYQQVPTWQKALAWVIVDRDENGDVAHIWRIPKPPDLGILFGTIPERIAEALYREDPKAFDKFVESVSQMTPPVLPEGIKPLIEWWANKSFFTGRRIVPMGAEDLPAGEQATSRTGEFARALGGATNLSPAKLENTVRGYAGGLGQYFLEGANVATREGRKAAGMSALPTPSKREGDGLEDLPGVRGFVVREPQLDAQPVQDVLDMFNEAEAHRQAWRKRRAAGDREGAAEYFKAHEKAIRGVATSEDGFGEVGTLRRAHDLIGDAQQLSIDATDETRRRVSGMAITAAKAVLAGETLRRSDIRALKREVAQRKAAAARNAKGTNPPQ